MHIISIPNHGKDTGPVHKGTNDVSDHDPLPDWVRDLNYVHSQALQTPFQSRTGSAHCEVIFCSYCTVCTEWPMHGFSAHFQNAHVQITFRKSFAFTCPQNQAFYVDHDPKRTFFHISKAHFKSPIWKSFVLSQRVKSCIAGFQIRKGSESRSETAIGMWFIPLWTGPLSKMIVDCIFEIVGIHVQISYRNKEE